MVSWMRLEWPSEIAVSWPITLKNIGESGVATGALDPPIHAKLTHSSVAAPL